MTSSKLEIYDLPSDLVPDPVPCAVLLPPQYDDTKGPLPLCLNLHGGGSSREALIQSQPMYEQLWQSGMLEPMVIATASTGELSFYLDEPGGYQWETFIAEAFLGHLRSKYNVRKDRNGTVMTGISMGGYGTLKIAFKRPDDFLAIASLEAAIQPGFERFDGAPRSRVLLANASRENQETLFKFMSSTENPEFFTDNSPASRLRANANAIRSSDMAIYLECGDHDAINLHDGNEFLHRLLWDLDISHEYHLVKDADHLGPSLPARMIEAFGFLSKALQTAGAEAETSELSEAGKSWVEWTAAGMQGEAPEIDLTSEDGVAIIREQFRTVREEVSKVDPTIDRRYAILPPTT